VHTDAQGRVELALWNVHVWGGAYILDANGIIRYKGGGGRYPEIETVLGELLGVTFPIGASEK
jgi:hypothetical protein